MSKTRKTNATLVQELATAELHLRAGNEEIDRLRRENERLQKYGDAREENTATAHANAEKWQLAFDASHESLNIAQTEVGVLLGRVERRDGQVDELTKTLTGVNKECTRRQCLIDDLEHELLEVKATFAERLLGV